MDIKKSTRGKKQVINANASESKEIQGYIKSKIARARKEIEKIEGDIAELQQN